MARPRTTALAALLGIWACGGDTTTSPAPGQTGTPGPGGSGPPSAGAPTRIVFQSPGGGWPNLTVGPFEDSVPVAPGIRYLVRAIPMDAAGNAYTQLTLDWSVAGGGSLDNAQTSPTGGADATLNGWSIGQSEGVEAVTVTLPAYPAIKGTIHVRSVNFHVVAISPSSTTPFDLGLGQQIPIVAQVQTGSGQPFPWTVTFGAGYGPSACTQSGDAGGFALTPGAAAMNPFTAKSDAQGMINLVYTAPTFHAGCPVQILAETATSPGGIGNVSTPAFWVVNITPAPATQVVLVSGSGQAAGPGTTLGLPLIVSVEDVFSNPVPGVTVTWSASSGGSVSPGSPTTDYTGRAIAHWTVGSTSGTQTATATIPGGANVTFTVTVS